MQYSLRIPDDDELMPEFCLWMYDSPRENLELDIWRQSWLIWKKNITKIYELSVIEFVFSRWGIYHKNENTRLFKKRFFPTGMTMITKSSRYGIIVKVKYDDCTVFVCYVLHYIETQRILWFNYMVHANVHKIHTDQINHLYIYVRNTEKHSVPLPDAFTSFPASSHNATVLRTSALRSNSDTVVNIEPVSLSRDILPADQTRPAYVPILRPTSSSVESQHMKPHKHCDTPRSNWFC